MGSSGFNIFGVRPRIFLVALLSSVFFIFSLLAAAAPGWAAVTGVTVSPTTKDVHSGQAVYVRANVQGTGDFDHRVNWSLNPPDAGNLSPTGLFISHPTFTGTASVQASSVENPNFSATATINVSAGAGVAHVDRNNAGDEDGTALHPYRTIQAAIDNAVDGETIKVAQGTYTENLGFPWLFGVLLLGGFQGGSAENYAAGLPGDFVTRSTDHVTLVTTIQSPARTNPVVAVGSWAPPNPLTYAVDGFTLTGGSHGLDLGGNGSIDFFISQNLITDNGVVTAGQGDRGGGINAEGINVLILDNRVTANKSGWGAGLYTSTNLNSFMIQGNLIENNDGGDDFGGGVILNGQGLFTWNVVRGNRANLLSNYGNGGGLYVNTGPVELSHNVYAANEANSEGAGILVAEYTNAVMRHELIYRNRTTSSTSSGGAALYVYPNTRVIMEHCTITGNSSAGPDGNGLKVRETATVQVSNSIIWGNSGDQLYFYPGVNFSMTYCDSQAYPGAGNLSVDPLFADPAADDYHLKSMNGRWNPVTSQWVKDSVQSPGIDGGNPAADFAQEPIPNGFRANLGAYGNTQEGSKSIRPPTITAIMSNYLLIE